MRTCKKGIIHREMELILVYVISQDLKKQQSRCGIGKFFWVLQTWH
jgi:hypothetical protein